MGVKHHYAALIFRLSLVDKDVRKTLLPSNPTGRTLDGKESNKDLKTKQNTHTGKK